MVGVYLSDIVGFYLKPIILIFDKYNLNVLSETILDWGITTSHTFYISKSLYINGNNRLAFVGASDYFNKFSGQLSKV